MPAHELRNKPAMQLSCDHQMCTDTLLALPGGFSGGTELAAQRKPEAMVSEGTDTHVVGLHVPVHDALRVAEVQRLQNAVRRKASVHDVSTVEHSLTANS